jgi:hypothetical protein
MGVGIATRKSRLYLDGPKSPVGNSAVGIPSEQHFNYWCKRSRRQSIGTVLSMPAKKRRLIIEDKICT